MSDYNNPWEYYQPTLADAYPDRYIDLVFDHVPTQEEIDIAAGGKEVSSLGYPLVGDYPILPFDEWECLPPYATDEEALKWARKHGAADTWKDKLNFIWMLLFAFVIAYLVGRFIFIPFLTWAVPKLMVLNG